MKICVISYDFWHYDEHIVNKLREKGVDAYHINIGAFGHKNLGARLKNTLSKIFLNKNLKNDKRQNFIIESLEKIGKQDQILVINPEAIEERVHQKIRNSADRNIAYLYDSMARSPAGHILHFFDTVFSFDCEDVKNFGFEKISNYNYLEFTPAESQKPELDLFYVTSYDQNRLEKLNVLITKLNPISIKFKVIIPGKKGWKKHIRQIFDKKGFQILRFVKDNIPQQSLPKYYKNTKVILDLMRENQTGLSFRVFDAMALEKKLITDNAAIKNYDFYNPHNILVLNKDFSNLEKSFFESDYQKMSQNIYDKYTLDSWVENVFSLN